MEIIEFWARSTAHEKTEMAAAADTRDGCRGRLPAEPDGHGRGGDHGDHGEDRSRGQHRA
jgi:hypothetical protein